MFVQIVFPPLVSIWQQWDYGYESSWWCAHISIVMFNVQQGASTTGRNTKKRPSEVIFQPTVLDIRPNKSWNWKNSIWVVFIFMKRHLFLERSWRSDDCSHLFGLAFWPRPSTLRPFWLLAFWAVVFGLLLGICSHCVGEREPRLYLNNVV